MDQVVERVGERRRRSQVERREDAERRILEAATRLVAQKGLDEFTLAGAGLAAGYSSGLPAHYFRSKAELLAAIAGHVQGWFLTGSRRRAGEKKGIDGLIAAVDFYFDACDSDRVMLQALHSMLSGALHKPALALSMAGFDRDAVALAEATIRAGIANGEIRSDIDARAWSITILATVRGIIAQWLVDPAHVDLPALRNNLVASLERSLQP